MKVTVRTITPEQAKKLLEKNTKNRPLSQFHVDFLCGVLKRGEWKLNGDAIRFNCDTLIDGQHRLAAVVKSDIPIQTVVATGVENGVFDTIDTGKVRGGGDTLNLMGIKNGCLVAAALKIINYVDNNSDKKLSNIQTEKLYEQYKDVSNSCRVANPSRKILTGSVAVGLHCLFSRVNQIEADYFFEALASGTGLKAKDPILTLRDKLIRNRDAYAKLKYRQIIELVIKAWNLHITGKKTGELRLSGVKQTIQKGLELK